MLQFLLFLENAETCEWKPGVRLVLPSLHLQALQMKTPTYIHLEWITFYTTFSHSYIQGLGVNHSLANFFSHWGEVSNHILVDFFVWWQTCRRQRMSLLSVQGQNELWRKASRVWRREREMEGVMRVNQLSPTKIVFFRPTYGADSAAMIKHFDVWLAQFLCLLKSPLSFFFPPLLLFNCFLMGVASVIACETASLRGVLQRKYSREIKEQKYENQNILKTPKEGVNFMMLQALACFVGGVNYE